MSWFLKTFEIDYKQLGLDEQSENYLKNLNNWDRGTAVQLIHLTGQRSLLEIEENLKRYKTYLQIVKNKIPNRFLFDIYKWVFEEKIRLPEDLNRLSRALVVFTQQNSKF